MGLMLGMALLSMVLFGIILFGRYECFLLMLTTQCFLWPTTKVINVNLSNFISFIINIG